MHAGGCAEQSKYPRVSIWVNERLKKKREMGKAREKTYSSRALGLNKREEKNRREGMNIERKRRESSETGRQQKASFYCDAVFCVYLWMWVSGAAHLCLFVCMNNSGPWRGQPAAVMRRTCIDSKYCWWEAIDLTTICPNFSQEAEAFCSLYWVADRWTGGKTDATIFRARKGKVIIVGL